MNPMLASSLVAAAAIIIIFLIWQRSVRPVSAAELLTRAESWDSSARKAGEPGVLYRRIRISTPHKSVVRDLYRDREGRRHSRAEQLEPELASLQPKLAAAGVSLDEPLSASAYREWHDRQQVKGDKVERSGNNLLTLTTTTDSSLVSQESLTVREDDFRPVRRTVDFKNTGTVEIAELNYAVMSWSAVNPDLFEPLVPEIAQSKPASHPFIAVALPTSAQLDSAELQALVALNRLQADTTEQIRVTRSNKSVDVIGVVETEQRKHEITAELRSIPHVTSSILSVEQLSQHPPAGSDITSVKEYSVGDQRFPLQDYLKQNSVTRDDLSQVSQRLLDACLQVQQKAAGLVSLVSRFPEPDRLPAAQRSAFDRLTVNYSDGIQAGLEVEAVTLRELGFVAAPSTAAVTNDRTNNRISSEELIEDLKRNQSLCQELIATNGSNPRPAPSIASDLLNSAARIRLAVRQLATSAQAAKGIH